MRQIYIQRNAPAAVAPTVAIVSITNIVSNGATINARVVSDGGSTVVSALFYFYAPMQPAVQIPVTPNADGTFGCTVSTLVPATKYYLTASATNAIGSGSASQYFTTASAITIPQVWINDILMQNLTDSTAGFACEVLSAGGGTISVSGLCWSTSTNPTTANSKTTNGPLTPQTFNSIASGLQSGTRYYFRAYATNEAGTSYSNEYNVMTLNKTLILQFDTNCPPTKAFTPSIQEISGTYEWDLGDGTTVQGTSVSHTYGNSNTKTVKLYCTDGTPQISSITALNQYIVGSVSFSHSAFSKTSSFEFSSNRNLSGVSFPASITVPVSKISFSYCDIAGTVNLSGITSLNEGDFSFTDTKVNSFVFGTGVSGNLRYFLCSSALATSIDLSGYNYSSQFMCSITNMPNLQTINFKSNSVSVFDGTAYFAYCPALDNISISSFAIGTSANNVKINLGNNNFTAAETNKQLVEINSITVAGYTGRYIWIDGTNAAPDSSSGGYDGLSAKNSLIAKGMYPQTN